MAVARTCFVPIFALAALFGGAFESALADRAAGGIGRAQPCNVDPAAIGNSADADTDDEEHSSHVHDWVAHGTSIHGVMRTGVAHRLDAPADIVALRSTRTMVLVRGPPARV